MATTAKVIEMYTGRSTSVDIVKETKCYYTVDFNGICTRFHKKTMTNWQMLLLIIN